MLVRLRNFFFPPVGTSRFRRVLPYAVLGLLTLILLTGGAYGWEYTNSPTFCGATCHTMPPEYAAYQVSPHARVACVECHIGRGFIATRITRKAGDIKHVTATLFSSYEYPIYADELRPARETCERCHFPSKFSGDTLRENVHFLEDEDNTRVSTFLAMRTGGGTRREGLGYGIHWHIENEVWFVALDDLQQEIPYVRVVGPDGEEDIYVALDSPLSVDDMVGTELQRMDCITCHNRISHNILPPDRAVDQALARRQIDASIPYIRREAVKVLSAEYETDEEAHEAIRALPEYYREEFPDFYTDNEERLAQAVEALLAIYGDTVFRAQEIDWRTHPNNIGHEDWPGCFRCHDGQHVNQDGEAIRLECNLCHSIPLVVEPGVIEPTLPLATGVQPDSHFNTHWIALHREVFDQTCQACHDVGNPGGTDNTSFCSNSGCHAVSFEFAGLDAPGLAEILAEQEAVEPTPPPTAAPVGAGGPTFAGQIEALFQERCTACHSQSIATGGLVLETYNAAMTGGPNGPVILPGDAEGSLLVQTQREGHFGQFTDDELQIILDWINNGAPLN
jgi:nitrate/TMAO reductase-like tetraheme cytochrome c subunit